jgi:hypothetical protein
MEIFITDYDTPMIVVEKLHESGILAEDVQTVMDRIVEDMMRITRTEFTSEGRRLGGSWKQLAKGTVRQRRSSHPILRRFGTRHGYGESKGVESAPRDSLFKSLTLPAAPFQIYEPLVAGFEFGTSRPYANVHQFGGGNKGSVPARPFLRYSIYDERKWSEWIGRHIVAPFVEGESEG